jgi:signal transduction histidine kinase
MTADLRKLNDLLNSLLTLAILNRDNPVQFSDIRIDELLLNVIRSVKEQFPGRKIVPDIRFTDNETDLVVSGNAGLLEIAFGNVIHNACKFSSGEVNVGVSRSGKLMTVKVSDHGLGIPAAEIPEIFKPFHRSENVKFIGGFGIGLPIVKKIMELHSAEIIVQSTEGEGTTFEFVFGKNQA